MKPALSEETKVTLRMMLDFESRINLNYYRNKEYGARVKAFSDRKAAALREALGENI